MLNDQYLMHHNNTLCHLSEYTDRNFNFEYCGDVHTGEACHDLLKHYDAKYIDSDVPTIICGLTCFIDGVCPDANYKHSVEPFSFTLSVFNRATRNLPYSWRNLGCISDTEKLCAVDCKKDCKAKDKTITAN